MSSQVNGLMPVSSLPTWRESGIAAFDEPPNWFAVYTSPRHEKAVSRQLDSRSLEFFLPLYKSVRRWKNGCRVAVEQPLFPGYVFVHVRRRDSAKVLQIPGIVAIVSRGRNPAPLPTADIESLRLALPQRLIEPHPYLAAGQKVRIVCGPLTGFVGVVSRTKSGLRAVLTLDLISQSIAVEVGIEEIEPVRP